MKEHEIPFDWTGEPAFNEDTSLLNQYTFHAVDNLPNEVHNDSSDNCIPCARKRAQAGKNGALKGEIYYTQAQFKSDSQTLSYEETGSTVLSKLISKEEFPRG